MFNRTFFKFLGVGVAIAILGVGVIYGLDYYRYRTSPEYKAIKYFKDLERQYREDPYGGNTPEETLQLFIDALKKGDMELASKYFVIEDQPKELAYLKRVKSDDGLPAMIKEAQELKLSGKDEERAFFTIADEKNIVRVQIVLGVFPNGRWKILEL